MNMNLMNYKTFANTINDAVFVMSVMENGKFRYEFINQESKRRFSFSDDMLGKTIDDVVDETAALYLNSAYHDVCSTSETVVFTDTSKDFVDETKLSPVFDEQGKVRMIIAITRDITELEEQRQALSQSNQRYHSLFEYNKAGIFELDRFGYFTTLNPAGERLLGRSIAELKDETFQSMVSTEDVPMVRQMLQVALDGSTVDYKVTVLDAKGVRKILDITHLPMIVDHEIVGVYGISKDITTEQKQMETIEYLSNRDPLTALPNRSDMKNRLMQCCTKAKSMNHSLAVIVIDVDDFKLINDAIGHDKGDTLIREIARRLVRILPQEFETGRVGGDEFMIIAPWEQEEELAILLEKCKSVFSSPYVIDGQSFYLNASIGVTEYAKGVVAVCVEDITKQAEMAMYASKRSGKGQLSFYDESMNDLSRRKLFLEQELRRALQNHELQVHYQPILEAGTNRVKSFEALVRWYHKSEGWIGPDEFIPVAETTGLIHQVGSFVLNECFATLASWKDGGAEAIRMSINISVKQLQGNALPHLIKDRLAYYRLLPQEIELEVTESVIMENFEKVCFTLDLLRDLGVYLSIDDFGTGYSSMSTLNRLPFHTIKIDRSFIADVFYDKKSRAILRSMIQLSNEMNLTTIAEGVESEEQYRILKEEGVHEVQGYYFTKPVPANEIEAVWLTGNLSEPLRLHHRF
ncbi:EAL domain-containing protein [Salisediminibacterium beveridgei]|uniref:Diguanylate cyclase/phosphodiesterase (GGDEF & EAL domains) with PAS/PAC sensor(S) n=1 Tax=Salisediminibacterium beveridgei TaxID=632773 RepID=A0A1D7QU70_9BACI|nr:EAL domain-containing protein [Salisediminibacterium beveridgei]AOM82537.1 diguanylate cyclase/phosphodiesterase (GGDEF & EAL domains) with PAS/PAC sensor(s) [Salisediminibacterium beveridgei]